MESKIEGVIITDLKVIYHEKGSIYHCLKESDESFRSFGESYFSRIKNGHIKAWKRHLKMICNLVVPYGKVKFILIDFREGSATRGKKMAIILGPDNYKRLTIPPGIWYGFKGIGEEESIIHNLASIEHDPDEQENIPLESFLDVDWSNG